MLLRCTYTGVNSVETYPLPGGTRAACEAFPKYLRSEAQLT